MVAWVVTVAEAETDGSPTEVAVIVATLVSLSVASAGTSTFTHTIVDSPGATVGVVGSGVVQVGSRKVTGNRPPELDIV